MATKFMNFVNMALIHEQQSSDGRMFYNISVPYQQSKNGYGSSAVNPGQLLETQRSSMELLLTDTRAFCSEQKKKSVTSASPPTRTELRLRPSSSLTLQSPLGSKQPELLTRRLLSLPKHKISLSETKISDRLFILYHIEMLERFHNSIFFFRSAYRNSMSLFSLMVIIPLFKSALIFDLSYVQT